MKIFVETERLILRAVEDTDVQGFFELDSDPEVHKYLGNQPIKTMEEAKATIDYVRNQYVKFGIGRWVVEEKASGEFVGWSGLKYEQTVRTDYDYYDIGYRLKRKFWGKGYATESATAALKYGFQVLNLEEIAGAAHIENIASNRVLRKIGLEWLEPFEFEGDPHHWYRLKKADWEAKG